MTASLHAHQIIELLNRHYGMAIQSVAVLCGGADMHATTYQADTASNSYFVKLKHGGADDKINLSVLRLLHDARIKEIIFPIQTLNGELSQQLDGLNIIVYPFIHAQNGFTRDLTEVQWNLLGKTLKAIHGITVPPSIQQQLRTETYSPKWRDLVKSLFAKMEADESDDTMTADFKLFFQRHINAIHQLVNAADDLARKIQSTPANHVLCHTDIHAGNVLLDDASIYIIDWDAPMLASKERDLMFIGGGVGNAWNKPYEVNYFYHGYGKTDINTTILAYYRHERIVEDIAEYSTALLLNGNNNQDRLIMLNHFKSMFDANGVVEIAFATQ